MGRRERRVVSKAVKCFLHIYYLKRFAHASKAVPMTTYMCTVAYSQNVNISTAKTST